MKFTKKERKIIYEVMKRIYLFEHDKTIKRYPEEFKDLCDELGITRDHIKSSLHMGMCALLVDIEVMKSMNEQLRNKLDEEICPIEYLPELLAQKPHESTPSYWWCPGLIEPRLNAVSNAIKLLNQKTNVQ